MSRIDVWGEVSLKALAFASYRDHERADVAAVCGMAVMVGGMIAAGHEALAARKMAAEAALGTADAKAHKADSNARRYARIALALAERRMANAAGWPVVGAASPEAACKALVTATSNRYTSIAAMLADLLPPTGGGDGKAADPVAALATADMKSPIKAEDARRLVRMAAAIAARTGHNVTDMAVLFAAEAEAVRTAILAALAVAAKAETKSGLDRPREAVAAEAVKAQYKRIVAKGSREPVAEDGRPAVAEAAPKAAKIARPRPSKAGLAKARADRQREEHAAAKAARDAKAEAEAARAAAAASQAA